MRSPEAPGGLSGSVLGRRAAFGLTQGIEVEEADWGLGRSRERGAKCIAEVAEGR